jgi:Arc/MetJ family transcription regulator
VRTTLNIDDELLAKATRYVGLPEKTAVVHEALRALIQREAARRLAARGGSDARAGAGARRRSALPTK